jgi:hypothetical protein
MYPGLSPAPALRGTAKGGPWLAVTLRERCFLKLRYVSHMFGSRMGAPRNLNPTKFKTPIDLWQAF